MNNPKISVLLPVWEEKPEYLKLSIESILNQTFSDLELLILDDATKNLECLEIIEEYAKKDARIKVIKNKQNIGATKTLNIGLNLAKGQYIARQDSDDISDKKRFEKQLAFMTQNPDCMLCGTWAKIINEDGKEIGKQEGEFEYEKIKKKLILINDFIHTSWFFRKETILDFGGYDEKMKKVQDYDLLLKLAAKHKIAKLPEYLCFYRVNTKGLTFSNNKTSEKFALLARIKAIKKYGYSKWQYLNLIRPIFFYIFIPSKIKTKLMHALWKI